MSGKRKPPTRTVNIQFEAPSIPKALQPAATEMPAKLSNSGLADAIGFNGSFPGNQGVPWSSQLSNTGTIFRNLRWYLVSNFRQMLNEAYVEIGLVQTICDVPVDDALRGGIEIRSKQLSEEQIEELQISIDRDDDLNTAGQAAKWNRLFGGAGILILTDQDPEEPLDVDSLNENSELTFRAVDMWELYWDKQNVQGFDPANQNNEFDFYSYYGVKVHRTRVMQLKGLEAPSFVRPRLRGWGFSVVEALVRSMNQYLKATDLAFEVLDEFKVDVYKIKNLVNLLMTPDGTAGVQRRIQMANWQKNYQNALVMDSEDEWDHKQLSFTGIGEAMQQIRMQVAADMRMPMIKLFGVSPGGMNTSGEDEIEVYNSMVESQVRSKIKYHILRIVELKCQVLFGMVPDDIGISFPSLRMLGAEAEENVKTQKFTRLLQARQAGEITYKDFIDGCNRGDLFDVKIDPSAMLLNPDAGDSAEKDAEDTKDAKGDKTPTADLEDSEDPSERPKVKNRQDTIERRFITFELRPFRRRERIKRTVVANSAAFDRAAYEADGGDDWIDPRRHELFKDPAGVDEALWSRGKEASQAALGEVRWQFVSWWYKKQGGTFN